MVSFKGPQFILHTAGEGVEPVVDSSAPASHGRGLSPSKTYDGLPTEGYVREKQILAPYGPIPISRSSWWDGVKSGKYPQPTKFFGERITAWDVADIRALIEQARQSH